MDAWPVQGTLPTSQWTPGEVISDPYLVQLSGDLPPGDYRLHVGLYLLATGERLAVVDESGAARGDERDHDFGNGGFARVLRHVERGFEDGAGLHLVDLWVRHTETAAAVAEHRVGLVEFFGAGLQQLSRNAGLLGDAGDVFLGMRKELVEWRISARRRAISSSVWNGLAR